jgi:hypothetical protein
MLIITIIAIFESSAFPRSIFLENQYNPAIHYQKNIELLFGTGIEFGLSNLRTYNIHSKLKSFSLTGNSFGDEFYRENKMNIGVSFPFAKKFTAGLSIIMLNYWIKDNYNRFGFSLGIGGMYSTGQFEFSGWLDNINTPKFSSSDYLLPKYSLRINYRMQHNFDFIFAVRGTEKELPFFNFGIACSPYEICTFGIGINTDPLYLEYMLKLNLSHLHLYYIGSNHQHLGLSHFFGVGFNS